MAIGEAVQAGTSASLVQSAIVTIVLELGLVLMLEQQSSS